MTKYVVRRDGEGIRVSLFDLEADVMEVVWSHRWDEFSVGDVHDALQQDREIAYTTVMTTVSRLFEKKVLDRRRDGRKYLYQPKFTRDGYLRAMTREVLERLPPAGHEEAIAYLVEQVAEADADTLERLEALIARRKEELGG